MEALTGMGDVRKHTNLSLAEIDDIPKHEASNRHASDTRIGLMNSTVPVEAIVGTVEPSHLSEMLGRDTAIVAMRGSYLSVPSLVRHHTARLRRWYGVNCA